jgi:hypothetical protein
MAYAHAVGVGGARPCTEGALATLRDVSARAAGYVEATDGWAAQEGALQAKANAAVVANAESYYRQMMFGDGARWPGGAARSTCLEGAGRGPDPSRTLQQIPCPAQWVESPQLAGGALPSPAEPSPAT